jgi:predicted enzyme related to lactoylglutathione lyase
MVGEAGSGQAQAWTELARTLAAGLETFASRAASEPDQLTEPVVEQPPSPVNEHALGKRQRQIVELPGLATEDGLKTADIASQIDYEVPNTYAALQALARFQVVEQVPDKEPQHWRLVRRYRAGNQVFARIVALIRAGEWTTAGDVSIAVRGDVRAAAGIVRAGLSPRVVLSEPVEPLQAAQLAAQGVVLLEDGRPDPRQRVSWNELAQRAAAEERRRSMASKAVLNYLQIPAVNLEESVTFYERVLGWKVKRHPAVGDIVDQTGYPEFTDSSGRAGGGFVLGRPPSREPGLLPCIAVDSIDSVLSAVVENGGEVVKPRTAIVEGADWEAIFRDPAGNAFGLYEGPA